jgi:hypothetical protein
MVPILPLDKLNVKFYYAAMKLSNAASAMGKKGGKARAARYDRKTLSKWAKLGGRPKKEGKSHAK